MDEYKFEKKVDKISRDILWIVNGLQAEWRQARSPGYLYGASSKFNYDMNFNLCMDYLPSQDSLMYKKFLWARDNYPFPPFEW